VAGRGSRVLQTQQRRSFRAKGTPQEIPRLDNCCFSDRFRGLLSVAIALGIQNHDDHLLTAQITQTEAELRAIGARITDIKDHDFNTMADYVTAHARVKPLLKDYDRKLHGYSDLCDTAQERDRQRRVINVQRLYNRYNPELWRNTSEIIELIRQINAVMKKEASVIRDMSSLPEPEQVQFWHEEFMPLLAQEHALRERLLLARQRMSPEPTVQ
jgi:hypothetical protein